MGFSLLDELRGIGLGTRGTLHTANGGKRWTKSLAFPLEAEILYNSQRACLDSEHENIDSLNRIAVLPGESANLEFFFYDFLPEGFPRLPFPERATVALPAELEGRTEDVLFNYTKPSWIFSLFNMFR